CPTGVATQDPLRQYALVVPDKAERVRMFHHSTLKALGELVGAAGLGHPSELRRVHIQKRVSPSEVKSFAELYPMLHAGELLAGCSDPNYARNWAMADPASFAAADPRRTAA
ncbi:MAG TPA: FMN-binding glutamate synthase family protein, partial [Stellaceae bacterium]|nr:FMN-binding glutamate synthase family protein [Stellaceae bacterium]